MSQILFFTSDSATTIPLEYQKILCVRKKKKILDFFLETTCSHDIFQTIEKKHIFNLIPEIKSPLFQNKFSAEYPIKLKLRIDKKLLPKILNKFEKEEDISQYLITISEQINNELKQNNSHDNKSLLITNNWYCLAGKQILSEQTIGFQTLWNEIEPQRKTNRKSKKTKNSKSGSANFWNNDQVSSEWEETSEQIGQFFDDLIDKLDKNITENKEQNQTISDIVKDFLREDNWNYLQLNDGITLQLTGQGNNGQITCYARSYDQQKQFIFYSLYPEEIPKEKRSAIAELITRINYGMIIGNLEMDFNDGELRYKTSIDVESDRLSPALVKRVVYANVLTMDQYLPAITAIVNEECSIEDAIAQVEK